MLIEKYIIFVGCFGIFGSHCNWANNGFLDDCCFLYDYIMSNIKYFGFGK